MSVKFKEVKLIYMTTAQNEKLLEIKNEVLKANGDVAINQLVRDAIDILIHNYRSDIVNRYKPIKLEKPATMK